MRQKQLRLSFGPPEIEKRDPPLQPPPKGSVLHAVALERHAIFWLLQSMFIGTKAKSLAQQEAAGSILQRMRSLSDEELAVELSGLGIFDEHDQLDLPQTITMSGVRRAVRREEKNRGA